MLRRPLAWLLACCLVLAPGVGSASVVAFVGDLAGFDAAAGSPPIAIDFDALPPGADLTCMSPGGALLASPDGNALIVVRGADTVSTPEGDADNRLFPTSGENLLSPGGLMLDTTTGVLAQRDGLRIVFAQPVSAFGLDLLFQPLDGYSLAGFEVRNANGSVVASNGLLPIPSLGNGSDPMSGGAQGGPLFVGFVSDTAEIARVDFLDTHRIRLPRREPRLRHLPFLPGPRAIYRAPPRLRPTRRVGEASQARVSA
jgi:hypothetical protein